MAIKTVKRYVRARQWLALVQLYVYNRDTLYSSPEVLACVLQAAISDAKDKYVADLMHDVLRLESSNWIVCRAGIGAIACGYLEQVHTCEPYIKHVFATNREGWIGLLWDMCGDEEAYNELKFIAIEDMSVIEREMWVGLLLGLREFGAAETLLRQQPNPANQARLFHMKGMYDEAYRLYLELARSDNPDHRKFGEWGVNAITSRRKASE